MLGVLVSMVGLPIIVILIVILSQRVRKKVSSFCLPFFSYKYGCTTEKVFDNIWAMGGPKLNTHEQNLILSALTPFKTFFGGFKLLNK